MLKLIYGKNIIKMQTVSFILENVKTIRELQTVELFHCHWFWNKQS